VDCTKLQEIMQQVAGNHLTSQLQEGASMFKLIRVVSAFAALGLVSMLPLAGHAQETTGGLQGTVKDPSGAVVPNAHVAVAGAALVGGKELDTDSSGYYRFANLPPGTYKLNVTAKGFATTKRDVVVEVGHLPTVDFALEVGASSTIIEVTSTAPAIDVTTTQNLTNITQETLDNTPHGYSFQSVIQYAPMARSEPLAGGSAGLTGGVGGSLPGSSGNGLAVGFSIGGAADRRPATWWKVRTRKTSPVALPPRTCPSISFKKWRSRPRASKQNMAARSAASLTSS